MKLDVYFHAGESFKPVLQALQTRSERGNGAENALRTVLQVASQHTTEIAELRARVDAQQQDTHPPPLPVPDEALAHRVAELEAMVAALTRQLQPEVVVEPSLPAESAVSS